MSERQGGKSSLWKQVKRAVLSPFQRRGTRRPGKKEFYKKKFLIFICIELPRVMIEIIFMMRVVPSHSVLAHGLHTICLCRRLLFYSKYTGFTVCFTYSDISLTMYINQ